MTKYVILVEKDDWTMYAIGPFDTEEAAEKYDDEHVVLSSDDDGSSVIQLHAPKPA